MKQIFQSRRNFLSDRNTVVRQEQALCLASCVPAPKQLILSSSAIFRLRYWILKRKTKGITSEERSHLGVFLVYSNVVEVCLSKDIEFSSWLLVLMQFCSEVVVRV